MPGNLEDGYQECLVTSSGLENGCQVDGYVIPSGCNQRVIWRSSCIVRHWHRTGKLKKVKFPG